MPKAVVKSEAGTTFVWPDLHAPYHNEEAAAVALAAIGHLRPTRIVILGDFYDCWAVSEHPKLVERRSKLQDEIDAAQPIAKAIARFGLPVTFIQGNHEWRIERHVAAHAPALARWVKTARDLLPLDWHYVPYKQSVAYGKMRYSHDFGRCGINAGRQGLLDLGENIVFGHTHKLGTTYVGYHVSLNCGWLGDVEAIDYLHIDRARREYQLGFGLVDEDETGCVWPQAVAIVGKPGHLRCVVRGRTITA